MDNAKQDAHSYLLKILIQKLNSERPGYIDELKAGIEADWTATSSDVPNKAHIDSIYEETLK